MFSNEDRDEHFLIDVLGTWVPECELVFWGLLNSPLWEEFYKLRENHRFNQKDVYLDHSYFTARDLIRYLSSIDDEYDDLPEEEIANAMSVAQAHYMYNPCTETMIRHSIMEIMYQKFVKSVTLVYPWEPRPIDIAYINHITPKTIRPKLIISGGDIRNTISHTTTRYTTIIMNSIEDLEYLVDHPKENRCDSTMFLLRNSSENMDLVRDESGNAQFIESKMETLLDKLVDVKSGIPKTKMRFGRFEPIRFEDGFKSVRGFTNI